MNTRSCLFLLLATAMMAAGLALTPERLAAGGKADASDRAQVMKFFREQVVGKTMATPPTKFPQEDDKMEGEYADRTVVNNFIETAEGFSFDWVTVSTQTLYDLDKGGKRMLPGRDFSGVNVLR